MRHIQFSKVVGETHLSFLTDIVAVHVPWDDLAVKPRDYHLASRIAPALPWVKVALITAQYLPPDGRVEKAPGGKSYGNMIPKEAFEKGRASGLRYRESAGAG